MQDLFSRDPDARILIRAATAADLPAIVEIYNDAIVNTTATFDTVPKAPEDMRPWFDAHDARHPVLVADSEEGVTVAFADLHAWSDRCAYDDTAEISIYVHPEHRGRRVGHRLMEALLDAGRAAGIHAIIARVSAGNDASLRIHQAFGFQMAGTLREVGKKFGRLIDVHVLEWLAGPERGESVL